MKQIVFNAECPACGEEFETEIEEKLLLEDPETPLTLDCPEGECGLEFDQAYTYTPEGGVVLGEVLSAVGDEDEDEDDEDEDDGEEEDLP